jgi:hypothetical protein
MFLGRLQLAGELLQKPCFLETEVALANDDMIQDLDLKNPRCRSDTVGEL